MSAGDLLGIGSTGLLAFQRALATTGHNIANVNTEGYSRQRAELATLPPQFTGAGYIGTGVRVTTISRVYSEFLTQQVRTSTSSFNRLDRYNQLAAQVDNLLTDQQSGLAPALQDFFNSVQDVANDPASIPARQVMLSQAGSLTDHLHELGARFDDLQATVNGEISDTMTEINSLASSIADINREIGNTGIGDRTPNDLLDKRDQLISELAGKISVSTVEQDDGSINVFIGTGQSLVMGIQPVKLTTVKDPYDVARLEVGYQNGGAAVNISGQITGGTLGGLLDFRRQVLDPAQNALGHIAQGLALSFNEQHSAGMDLNGALGGDFFTVPTPAVLDGTGNTGSGNVTVTLNGGSGLTTSDYLVKYNGGGFWSVTRRADNYTQSGSGPFSLDDMTITVGGTPSAGDTYLIQPTHQAMSEFGVAINDTRKIAAAAPIRTSAALGNTSDAAISAGTVIDASNPNLLDTVTINFTDPNNYQVNGAGPLIPYTDGNDIDINGWRVQITGTPAAGDVFTVQTNSGGISDNRNMLALADLQTSRSLFGGSASYGDAYGRLVADVGSLARSAQINRDAQSSIRDHAISARDGVSGVNLDEEAANLVRYQQAYQAAAQVITTANNLFDTLLTALRG